MTGPTDFPQFSPVHLETFGIFLICYPKFQRHIKLFSDYRILSLLFLTY